jgi:DNA-directed RNA polymerase alpha subunit
MRILKSCTAGHQFYRSPDQPSCPVCEIKRKPKSDALPELAVPARRALIKEGIDSLLKLSRYRESEIVALHGLGQRSIPKLKNALKENGLAFKE